MQQGTSFFMSLWSEWWKSGCVHDDQFLLYNLLKNNKHLNSQRLYIQMDERIFCEHLLSQACNAALVQDSLLKGWLISLFDVS